MKKSDLKPGTKVLASIEHPEEYSLDEERIVRYTYDEYGDNDLIGVVRSKPAAPGKVFVSWIEGDRAGESEGADKEAGEEVDIKVLSLLSDRSVLDKEFRAAEKQIKEKLKEAGKIIREANKMAQKAGARHLASMYDAVDPLVDAMDDSGWSSSSWNC